MSKPDFAEESKQPTKSRKKNALTHGIYGKDILLPWESCEEFEKLLAELQDEFQPNGRMENEIAFDVGPFALAKISGAPDVDRCSLRRPFCVRPGQIRSKVVGGNPQALKIHSKRRAHDVRPAEGAFFRTDG